MSRSRRTRSSSIYLGAVTQVKNSETETEGRSAACQTAPRDGTSGVSKPNVPHRELASGLSRATVSTARDGALVGLESYMNTKTPATHTLVMRGLRKGLGPVLAV